MAASISDTLVRTIQQRVKFIEAQVGAGLDQHALLTDQCTALAVAIRGTVGLTVDTATEVQTEINAGPWAPTQKVQLANALSEAVAS
eukprot:1277777-Pyramimonas_sp.AAC.1